MMSFGKHAHYSIFYWIVENNFEKLWTANYKILFVLQETIFNLHMWNFIKSLFMFFETLCVPQRVLNIKILFLSMCYKKIFFKIIL